MTVASDRQRQLEKYAGLALMAAAALALLAANGPFADIYSELLHWKVGPGMPRFGRLDLHQWVADGLMAVFFLLVGLEVKRECHDGRLSNPADRKLPIIAAIAGMAVPALLYIGVSGGEGHLLRGWAIPAATDIAFAIGVLAILGRNAPASVKLLLVTIAIVDDIGAVLVIALFYTADLNVAALAAALAVAGGMAIIGRLGVRTLWPYMLAFAFLWLLVLASGIHASISGVAAALAIPHESAKAQSPLERLERRIHPWVMFGVVPVFGFVSAGVAMDGGFGALVAPLPLAIFAGLFIGKQLGVFGAIWLAVRTGLAPMPRGTNWLHIYGASVLCGIGFTMSLFIGALAFPGDLALVDQAKIGTIAGSVVSALVGFLLLRLAPSPVNKQADVEEAGALFGADQPD